MQQTEGVVARHIAAVNAFDVDAIMETFSDDALVNDNRREFVGREAVRRWVDKEMVGDKVTIEVREVLGHRDQVIVRGAYDGEFDRAGLPDELILTNYFTIEDDSIVTLMVIRTQ
jgi:ketosteroid isomerase-like protein